MLGQELTVGPSHQKLWAAEFGGRGAECFRLELPKQREYLISRLTTLTSKPHDEQLSELTQLRERVKDQKKAHSVGAKTIRSEVKTRYPKGITNEDNALADIEGWLRDESIRISKVTEDMLQGMLVALCAAPDGSARRVLENREGFPSIMAWLGLSLVAFASKGFALNVPKDDILSPGRNDHVDAALASVAAYAECFITRDRALSDRCLLLQRNGWLQFEAYHLDDLELAGVKA